MRRSASSRRAWQKRERCTPRSYSRSDSSRGRSPSSSFLTTASSSAIAASKSLMVVSDTPFHLTRQLAALDGYGDAIAGGHARRVANHLRAIRIPAHGVASRQHPEGTQAFETGDRRAESRIERMATAIEYCRKSTVAGNQPGAESGKAATQIERFERKPQRLIPALPRRQARAHRATQLVRQFAGIARTHGESPSSAGDARPRIERAQPRLESMASGSDRSPQSDLEPVDARDELVLAGNDHLRGR